MDWYYSNTGSRNGPVSPEVFDGLVRSGIVQARTLIWREGFPAWKPFSTIGYEALPVLDLPAGAVGGVPFVICGGCSRALPREETVSIDGTPVCAVCKPLFLQRMREGVMTGPMSGMWRSGRKLVTGVDSTLPARCVKCNAPGEGKPYKRNLYWHPPLIYLTLIAGVIIYVIIAVVTRKRAVVFVSLCQNHRTMRRNGILLSWLLFIGGIAAVFLGVSMQSGGGWVGAGGGAAILAGLIYALVCTRLVVPKKIDTEHAWLGGFGEAFLAEFPEWPGPR